MRPCAILFDAQAAASLSWKDVRDSEFVWDFDDGGSTRDSEGFLAAVVYEKAGTYRPTVTVGGETWNAQTITVIDPRRTRCVSLAAVWEGCPAGATQHKNVREALSGLPAYTHVLFRRGEDFGSQNLSGYADVTFGAFGSGDKPIFRSATTWTGSARQTWMDLEVSASGPVDNMIETRDVDGLILRVDGESRFSTFLYTEYRSFVFNSDLSGASYGFFLNNPTNFVLKESTVRRSVSGQTTIRSQGGNRLLFQHNEIVGGGKQGSLSLRGNIQWALVQGNFFDETTSVNPEYAGADQLQEFIVWERNVFDATSSATQWGQRFVGHNMIVRNNVTYNCGQWHFKAESVDPIAPQNIWFINNTAFTNKSDAEGVVCGGSGCVNKNNLFYSTRNAANCFVGGTQATNWCRTANTCLDPVTGGSACYEPKFVSVDRKSPDFVRPGAGARGTDAGDRSVPVWDDLQKATRTAIDVGAIER
jgi:PKD repeat protein